MPDTRSARVPAPVLVLVAIGSVQIGSAVARTLFDELGAGGSTLLRLALSALMLLALVQTRRWADGVWALLAASGVVLLGADSSSGIPLSGLAFALLAGLFWAAYILASARVGQLLPGLDGLAVALAVAALLVLPYGAGGASAVLGAPALLLGGLAIAVLSSVVPYGLEMVALRRMPTRVFGILMSLEPAAAALAGLVVLGQALGVREVTALLLVSVASAGVTLGRREGEPVPQPLE